MLRIASANDDDGNRCNPFELNFGSLKRKRSCLGHYRMGYRWKAGSETRTMAVSLGRSDVLGAQECDRAESPGSRDVSGSVFAPKPTKNRIRSYPMDRTVITRFYGDIFGVFTGLGGHPGCLYAKGIFFLQKESLGPRKYAKKRAFCAKGIFGSA